MITVDGPISFLVGGAVAYACRSATGDKVRDRDRTLTNGLILQSVVLTPVILFFMLRFPDWEWNYMLNAQALFLDDNPGFGIMLIAVIVAVMNLSYLLGFYVTENMIKKEQTLQPIAMLVSVVVFMGAVMFVMMDEALHIGTLAEYESGDAPLIFFKFEFLLAQTVAVVLIAGGFKKIVQTARHTEA